MTYFFILPAFLVYLLTYAAILLISAFLGPAKPLFPYIWRTFLLSIIGFFAANIFLWAFILGLAKMIDVVKPSDQIHKLIGIPSGLALFLGPIPASFIGIILGIIIGTFWAISDKRRSSRNKQ